MFYLKSTMKKLLLVALAMVCLNVRASLVPLSFTNPLGQPDTNTVRVISLEKKSHDVMVVKLQLPANDSFQFHAGQYIDFLLRDGSRRSYSMANAPHTLAAGVQAMELHIRHMPGGKFTDHVFGAMKEKEIQRVEGPQGGPRPELTTSRRKGEGVPGLRPSHLQQPMTDRHDERPSPSPARR